MTLEEIQAIIRQINDSDIREIDLDYQDIHLYLNKNKTSRRTNAPQNDSGNIQPVSATQTESLVANAVEQAPEDLPALDVINAPLVGVIYLQPSPDQTAYKSVGDHVAIGDVVCVIEAMKMMTEIKSKVAGTISEILVENEEVVEFDQPLFKVTK